MITQRQSSTARSRTFHRFALAVVVTAVAVGGILFAGANQAVAGDRRKVCWEKVYVRNHPRGWAWSQLNRGQTFEVYEYRPTGWARGFAYGQLNTNRSPREIGQPYRKDYADVWIQVAAFCPR